MSDQEDPRLGLPSASKLEIVCECPGSVELQKALPIEAFQEKQTEEDKEQAERGNRIHKARETGNLNHLSPEEFELYQSGMKYEEKMLEKWKHTFALGEAIEGPRELRLYLHNQSCETIGSGQLDVHFFSGTHAIIIDWKSGFCSNLTSAKSNWQLRMQAVLLWMDHPGLTNIRVGFSKPMFDSDHLDFCDYEEIDLKYSYESMVYHLWWSTQGDAWRRAGSHCRYCPARNGYCPEALAYALLPSVIVKNVFSKKDVAASVNEVSMEDLYKVWRMGSIVRNILDGVTKRLKGAPEDKLTEIGLRLAPGRKNYEIVSILEAIQYLRDVEGWPEEVIYNCLEFVAGRMVEHLNLKGMSDDAAKTWIREHLKAFIEESQGEKIVKEI